MPDAHVTTDPFAFADEMAAHGAVIRPVEPKAPAPPLPPEQLGDAPPDELVIQPNGQPRQAGATQAAGQWTIDLRLEFECSLYAFAKGICGRRRLTNALHKPDIAWLQSVPPHGPFYRKLWMLPRDHFKSVVVSQALPLHLFIQPADANIYLPGRRGTTTRILMTCEAQHLAAKHLRWIMQQYTNNEKLRGLWPEACWDDPRRESPKWNEHLLMMKGAGEHADASIEAVGVGTTITGGHFDALLKDDLCTLEAANSSKVMETAWEWHVLSRALTDDPDRFLEFMVGTHWSPNDVWKRIKTGDPSVQYVTRSIVENNEPILPLDGEGKPRFTPATIQRLRDEFGTLFPLLYMNSASDPLLTDFQPERARYFAFRGNCLSFTEDERDALTAQEFHKPAPEPDQPDTTRGQYLTAETYDAYMGRQEYLLGKELSPSARAAGVRFKAR